MPTWYRWRWRSSAPTITPAGISVWDYDDATVQVVVPGNVGGQDALVDVISAMQDGAAVRREG